MMSRTGQALALVAVLLFQGVASQDCSIAKTACACARLGGECGWSKDEVCELGKSTSCKECPTQTICLEEAAEERRCARATTACKCAELGGECGWSDGAGKCEVGKTTNCKECPTQATCLAASKPAGQIFGKSPDPNCEQATSACTCAKLGPACGWSKTIEKCQAGKTTSCDECEGQVKCIAENQKKSKKKKKKKDKKKDKKDEKKATKLVPAGTCVDLEWKSSGGSSCGSYERNNLCTIDGDYGSGWKSSKGTFDRYAVDGVDATDACCACGGGTTIKSVIEKSTGDVPSTQSSNTCRDNPNWKDQDGDDCTVYRNHPKTIVACNSKGYEAALIHCPSTCNTCPPTNAATAATAVTTQDSCAVATTPCECANLEKEGCGWSSLKICRKGSTTDCKECSTMKTCKVEKTSSASTTDKAPVNCAAATTPCECATLGSDGCGWSSLQICRQGSTTDCKECSTMKTCKTAAAPTPAPTKKAEKQKTCEDLKWTSVSGSTCRAYKKQQFCTKQGGYGPGWKSHFGTFADYANKGVDATRACCACGGGRRGTD